MYPYLTFAAAALLVIGLAGNGFEMMHARMSALRDGDMSSRTVFASKRNFKWYACIGVAIGLAALGTHI